MKHHPAWLAAGLLLCVVLACNLARNSNTNTNLNANKSSTPDPAELDLGGAIYTTEAHMAKDNGLRMPGATTETFEPGDHTIHCVTTLKNRRAGTQMRFAWWKYDTDNVHSNKIQEISYTTARNDRVIHGHLTAERDWSIGRYKVQIYVNGDLDRTVFFNVNP